MQKAQTRQVTISSPKTAGSRDQRAGERNAIARLQAAKAEAKQRNAELALINDIQKVLASRLDFQSIVNLVGDKLREAFHTPDLGISWYDEKANLIRSLYEYEHGEKVTVPTMQPRPNSAFVKMKEKRRPLVWKTTEEGNAISKPVPGADGSRSGVYIPIISSNRVIGSIRVENFERENAYGKPELRVLTTVAAALGSTLENARLFDENQRLHKETGQRAHELTMLNSVQLKLASKLDAQAIYELIGEKLCDSFPNTYIDIRIYDPETNLLHWPYVFEKGKRLEIDPIQLPKRGFVAHILRTRKTLVINENMLKTIMKYGSFLPAGFQASEREKSAVHVPLIMGDRVLGMISVANAQREHAFSDADVRLLETLANSMSVALENAQLFNETQRLLKETEQRAKELAMISSVQLGLTSNLDVGAIYELIVRKLRDILPDSDIDIRIYDPETNMLYWPYVVEKGRRIKINSIHLPKRGFVAHVLRTRKTLVINENMMGAVLRYGSFLPAGFQNSKLEKSAVHVPLAVVDKVFGAISIANAEREHAFSDADVCLLETLANSMSIALENARLFEETQRLLEQTQRQAREAAAADFGRT